MTTTKLPAHLQRIWNLASMQPTKAEITDVVKKTENDALHTTHRAMSDFMGVFTEVVKQEFVKRAKAAKKAGEKLITSVGEISYQERANYKVNEEQLLAFLSKKKISEEMVYSVTYEVASKDPAVIAKLLSVVPGAVVKKLGKIDHKELTALIEKYPELDDVRTNDPTEFVKGL